MNVVFVGDLLQLPTVKAAHVFEPINNKTIQSKLGCRSISGKKRSYTTSWRSTKCKRKTKVIPNFWTKFVVGLGQTTFLKHCKARSSIAPPRKNLNSWKPKEFSRLSTAYAKCLRSSEQRNAWKLDADIVRLEAVDSIDETNSNQQWSKKAQTEFSGGSRYLSRGVQ